MNGSRDLLRILGPFYISGPVEAGNFKFGRILVTRGTKEKN